MISTKKEMVTTNVLHQLGIAALTAAAWVVGVELVFDLLALIFNHNLQSFLVSLQGIPTTLANILPIVLAIYFLVTPYIDFKWAIQNGVSRRTMWQGRLLALLLSTILIDLIDELLALTYRPMYSWSTLLIHLLGLLTTVLTFQAIGNGFGLLSRKGKVIVGIGLPIVIIILLMMLMSAVDGVTLDYSNGHFIGSLGWLFNLLDSSATPWILWAIYLAIVLFLTKFFNDRMQLRRD